MESKKNRQDAVLVGWLYEVKGPKMLQNNCTTSQREWKYRSQVKLVLAQTKRENFFGELFFAECFPKTSKTQKVFSNEIKLLEV